MQTSTQKSRNNMMLFKGTFLFILVTQLTSCSTMATHPDCDRNIVLNRFISMCKAYMTIKREATSESDYDYVYELIRYVYESPSGNHNGNQPSTLQQQPPYQYSQNYHGSNTGLQQPMTPVRSQTQPYYAWQGKPHPNFSSIKDGTSGTSLHGSQALGQQQRHRPFPKERSLHPPMSDPSEPEDFAAFNYWYLNPVYADAEWQSSIERWRRTVKEEIRRFVKDKCCSPSGCPFPEDYYELDRRINICRMR